MGSPHRDRRTTGPAILALLIAMQMIGLAWPAFAACHVAAFTDDSPSVKEGAGRVTLTVELVGGSPSCSGTVRYETVDGTAKAGSDYTPRQGMLTFVAGDDRRESFTVPITNDTSDEAEEMFTVTLSGGTGNISADDSATVAITDNDEAAQPTTSPPPSSPTPTPSETPTQPPAPAADTGSNAGLIAGIVLAIAALIGAGIWLLRKRAAG